MIGARRSNFVAMCLAFRSLRLTAPLQTYLRQGCNLVPDIDNPRKATLVNADGSREDFRLTHEQAIAFGRLAAKDFGVGESRLVKFEPDRGEEGYRRRGYVKPRAQEAREGHR